MAQQVRETAIRRAASDEPAESKSDAEFSLWKSTFLTALRVPEDPQKIIVLGISSFTAANEDDPQKAKLEQFGRRIGADYVVTCVFFAGRENRTMVLPFQSTTAFRSTAQAWDTQGNYAWGTGSGSATSTNWVPMEVQVNRFNHMAFFLRVLRPDDARLLTKE